MARNGLVICYGLVGFFRCLGSSCIRSSVITKKCAFNQDGIQCYITKYNQPFILLCLTFIMTLSRALQGKS